MLPADEYVEYWTADEAIRFIEDTAGPFYLHVGFCGPHPPFDPPAEYVSRYRLDDIPPPPKLAAGRSGLPPFLKPHPRLAGLAGDTRPIRKAIAHYWALMDCLDAMLGRVLECLERRRLADNTMRVIRRSGFLS